jgi:hypothetical protein
MHSFWSSHEEKRDCVRLSMGGQLWPELELHGRPWGAHRKGGRGGTRRGRGGAARVQMGRYGEGCYGGGY